MSVLSEGQSVEWSISDGEDRKSEAPKIVVVVLSVLLLFAFLAVLAVLLIGSPDGDDNERGRGGHGGRHRSKEGRKGEELASSPPLAVEILLASPRQPSADSVTSTTQLSPTAARHRTVRTLSPTHPPGVQSCPIDAYHGKRIGSIASYSHAVSGFAYAASENSVFIKDLDYDGTDPAASFWAEHIEADLDQVSGDKIQDETGSNDVLKAYTKATVLLKLPKKITAYQTLGIYSPQSNQYFGFVRIPSSYELPKEKSLGQLTFRFGDVVASDVVLMDSTTMLLKGFENHGQCPSTYFVAAATTLPHPEELTYLVHNGNKIGEVGRYNSTDMKIQLPEGCHWNQFKWFSVFCFEALSSIADVEIDPGVAERLPLHSPSSLVSHE